MSLAPILVWLVLALAAEPVGAAPLGGEPLGGKPESVLVPAGQVRMMVLADAGATVSPGGTELSPMLAGGRYLYLTGAAVPTAGVEALMAPVSPEDARAVATVVASGEPLVGTLSRTARDVELTEGSALAPECRHARIEQVVLALAVGGLTLSGQRALPDRAPASPGACPTPG